jgi:hypothetical protein
MEKLCPICNRPARNNIATYCQFGCGKLVSRARSVDNAAERDQRLKAVKSSWRNGSFRCHYAGIELEIFDSSSPFYFSFDHVTPREGSKIVACSAFINDVKSDSTEEEFKHNTIVLANHFSSGTTLHQSDFKVKHYKRHKSNV